MSENNQPLLGGDRVRQNDEYLNNLSGKHRTEQATWLASLGVKFVDVMICTRDGILYEEHVDDIITLPDTVAVSMDRHKARSAVYPWLGRWALQMHRKVEEQPNGSAVYCGTRVRYYDTKEAAEMVAIHNG